MLEGVKNYIFFVVDQENKGILGYAPSPSIANAVSKGLANSSVMLVPAFNIEKTILDSFNTNFKNNFKLVRNFYSPYSNATMMTSEGNVCEPRKEIQWSKHFDCVPITVSDEWLEKRKIAGARINKLKYIETIIERYLTRFKQFTADSIFYNYLGSQINLCDPDLDHYSSSIIEWAEISDLTPKAAYYHLKMQYESASITIFRANAIWNR